MRFGRVLALVAVALAVTAAVALASDSGRRAVAALRLTLAVGKAAAEGAVATAAPRPRPVTWQQADGVVRAGDLYGGRAAMAAPLVLIPGAAPRGKDDPRLVGLARGLAEAGFAVLVPDIASLRALRVGPEDAAAIAGAVAHLAALSGRPRVGLAAISVSAGPAIMAALAPARERVGFVLAVGGYYDMTALATFLTTGQVRDPAGGPWRARPAHPYGLLVLAISLAARLPEASDRELYRAIVEARLENPDADVETFAARLGPGGRALWALLTNREPERVAALIAALPAAPRAAITGLDLARLDLAPLGARLILVHGKDDQIIPYEESRRLLAAAPAGQARLFIVPELAHVTLGATGIEGAWALYRAAYALIEERDALARAAAP